MRNHVRQLAARRAEAHHPGLLLNRFLAAQNDEGVDKRALIEAAVTAGRAPALVTIYRRAFERWLAGLPEVRAVLELTTTPSTRLIVGLGSKGVIDAGVRLHHTYGVPLVPGSALKGLAAHYCGEVWGTTDERYRREREYHRLLFGTTDDGGVIRFEDAWLCPDSLTSRRQGLLADVMTPHHQKWQTDAGVAPTDFDSPVPVPFLSVAGRFSLAVCWQGPEHGQALAWTKRALALLEEALKEWGVGGKTTSGYGRLVVPRQEPKARAAPKTVSTAGASPARPAVAATPGKRLAGAPARVTIVAVRPKGGFDVQEAGKARGTLTLGIAPLDVSVGAEVDVLIHNDDSRNPQYRWPAPPGGGKK